MKKEFIKKFLAPKSSDEDSKRREFILNVLLLSVIALFFIATLVDIFVAIYRPLSYARDSLSVLYVFGTLALFCLLYFLSKKGFAKISAHIFIFLFTALAVLMGIKWGVDVNASLLLYALSIVMAGILINTRLAFILTIFIAVTMTGTHYFQNAGVISVNNYWRNESWKESDTIMTVVIFFSVAVVSWLSNREIEKSLTRARESEKLLKKERDMLEVTVVERTKKLREAEAEKISQLYRFAEFGRLSSGLFHDLINPLNAISLNMEKVKGEKEKSGDITKTRVYLDHAISASKKMESFIGAIKKQIAKEKESRIFSLRENTRQVMDILSYKAHLAKVIINFVANDEFLIFGEEVKWRQEALNLISNAIDSYDEIKRESFKKEVEVSLKEKDEKIVFTIADHGEGIKEEHILKIFEPFFSTKPSQETKGTGIGLSMTKNIVEKNFRGEISVKSNRAIGTIFSVIIPKYRPPWQVTG